MHWFTDTNAGKTLIHVKLQQIFLEMFLEIFKKNKNITHLCITYLTWDRAKPIVTN